MSFFNAEFNEKEASTKLFSDFKNRVLGIDPVVFCEENLTLDGAPFRLTGNGYKPFADIYRNIALKAVEPGGKPIILVKGRQVGATTMASALEAYFMACGLYGYNGRSPMRVMHLFPSLNLAGAYSKSKLNSMISTSKPVPGAFKKNGMLKSMLETKLDTSNASNNNLFFKKFIGGNELWVDSTGLDGDRVRGRQLSLDTELPTPTGFIKLKDLKVGDKLFDENGDICNVTKLHPIQKTPEAYKVTFDDGTVVEACAEHLWLTYTKQDRIKYRKFLNGKRKEPPEPVIKNTKEILETFWIGKDRNHSIPNCKPVKYNKKEQILDPYLFGFWLGDGSQSGLIETADPEVLEGFEHHVLPSSDVHYGSFSCNPSKSKAYRVKGLTTKLTQVGVLKNPHDKTKAFYNKHIPKNYLQGSFEQRLALLQGLMDSGGCCYKDGRCEFTQVRKELSYQVFELIKSLGIKATIKRKKSLRYNKRYKDAYSIMFMTKIPVFRLKRKLDKMKKNNKAITKTTHRFIKKIEPIDTKPMRCITVDSPSHLYLITRSFIPTHNTLDCCIWDEIQDLSREAIGTSTKCLAKSKYGNPSEGVQVYFGTPKGKGGVYWDMWQKSTQQYYHLSCEKCGNYFPLYRPDVNWEDIWLYGFIVKCTFCSHEQDKRVAAENGKWIALNSEEDSAMYGYHLNQLYMPDFPKEVIINAKPEKHPSNSEIAYMNEVLGEFFDGEGGTLTVEELRTQCGDINLSMVNSITSSEKRIYAGFDWGQKSALDKMSGKKQQGKSYSCGVILSADGPKLFSVKFCTRFKQNDPEYKREQVGEFLRRFKVNVAVGDIGDAFDLTHDLQTEYGERFLASRAVPKVNGHIKFDRQIFPKEIKFERDYYISELIGLLRNGNIKFPFKGQSYEAITWLVKHCTSMEIKITRNKTGDPVKHYIKGSTPNDGFMALLNAYLAWKFDVTQGFKIRQPQQMKYDKATKGKTIQGVLGYIPGASGL